MTELEEVAAVAAPRGASTAIELRDALRGAGRVSMTTADVVRVLATHPNRFRADDADPPRWCLTTTPVADPASTEVPDGSSARTPVLYSWQNEALDAWRRRGGRGVVEAITGTGKTMVGIAAACDELARGGQVVVLVPTRELLDQWADALVRHGPRHARIGLLGGGHRGDLGTHDIVIAIVNSARDADLRPRRPGGLLVADECHRYGSDGNRVTLHTDFARRLGLSATYARADDGHLLWLDPYFGGTCFRMGYERAIRDGVIAPFEVALAGVALTPAERAEYEDLSDILAAAGARLIASAVVPAEPIGVFFAAVARLARSDNHPLAPVARSYLRAMQERRRLLAETPAKEALLDALVPTVRRSERAIVFTQSIAASEAAAARLRHHGLAAEAIHSHLHRNARRDVMSRFVSGHVAVLAAPQVLDEGVDVPAADLGIILAASRTRRQMIQRMGRVLRRKDDGRSAKFAIAFAVNTIEDPAHGAHAGFLDEITPVAETVHTFAPGASISDL